MRTTRRILMLVAATVCMSSVSSAYYHWIFFANPGGPYIPIPARFDIGSLPDQAVNYFISDQGPSALAPGDTQVALNRQIQEAASVWNRVNSSALRLRFGGVKNVATPQSAPGIDVIFDDDMPPGILAQTRPTFPADLSFLPNQGVTFVPLQRSVIQLRKDFTATSTPQHSYSDTFFLTLVHEFGHALGLQHTLTSGVMSTAVTRATYKGSPLAADDIAAISALYPTAKYAKTDGVISGMVTLGDAGVNMASVVAISDSGTAVSALTNPDGSYAIHGIPQGQYRVYVHPLPPARTGELSPAAIMAPVDVNGNLYPAQNGFDTRFYPASYIVSDATVFDVVPGTPITDVNFVVQQRDGPKIYGMETYGYQGTIPVASPPLLPQKRQYIVFHAPGTTVNGDTAMAPGLNVVALGDAARVEENSLRYYTQGFLLMIVATNAVDHPTPVTLVATLPNEVYILPAAFTVMPSAPPSVSGVAMSVGDNGVLSAGITGANLSAQTKILIDGVRVPTLSANDDGSLVVLPPPALSGHIAVVEAINPDGQSSLQAFDPATVPTFTYPTRDSASIQVDTPSIIAGTDSMVSITGTNTSFAQGKTAVGFGSSDITVRRVWVMDLSHLLVNVTVNAAVPPQAVSATVSTGLELVTNPTAISVTAPAEHQVTLRVPIRNSATGLAGVPAGGKVIVPTSGLPENRDGWTLTIGGQPTTFSVDEHGVITADVPASLSLGPQIVQLNTATGPAAPAVLVQIDAAPPTILSVFADAYGLLQVPKPGDAIAITVDGITEPNEVWLEMNGEVVVPDSVSLTDNGAVILNSHLPLTIPHDPDATTADVSIRVGSGTRLSDPTIVHVDLTVPPPQNNTPAQ